MLLRFLIVFLTSQCVVSQHIANDVVNDYALVKELLGQFYQRAARKYGNDYNAENITNEAGQHTFNDGTEASVNRKIWAELFENDIILTLPQAENLLKENGIRGKRQAQPTPSSFWPNLTISYEFAFNDPSWRNLIRSGLRHLEQNTCMRFKENGLDRDGLKYFRGSGCWSNVGKVGGRQLVSIGYGCDALGIVAHETLHALGLWHEQSRDDRDNYITIVSDRIIRGTQGNFEKRTSLTSDNMGQPYDLGSVMHYGSKAFTQDWKYNTITTKDKRYQQTIGQRDGISFKDAKMINLRYCKGVCQSQLPCQNDGYTDPNDCRKCRCPKGYGGIHCQDVESTSCGREIIATSYYQTLQSGPVYAGSNCIWRIKSPSGEKIELVVDYLSFPCTDPCTSFVEVKTDKIKTATGARLCCSSAGTFTSESDDVLLIFRGDSQLQNGYLGFTVRYRAYGVSITSAPVTTTTTPTTTSRISSSTNPATTSTNPNGAEWGVWGAWSTCSEPCGGCGVRRRIRGCYGGDRRCRGYAIQSQSCNTKVCSGSKTAIICHGRILLPCDLVENLEFGEKNSNSLDSIKGPLPLDRSHLDSTNDFYAQPKNNLQNTYKTVYNQPDKNVFYREQNVKLRGSARVKRANVFCEKRFTYQCPTNLLTIRINWKTQELPSPVQRDNPQCCPGYFARNGYCYKN